MLFDIINTISIHAQSKVSRTRTRRKNFLFTYGLRSCLKKEFKYTIMWKSG